MINCIECPFLTLTYLDSPDCGLGFKQLISHKLPENIIEPVSKDCKLDAVTYSLKDKEESINFVPKEMEVKPKVILCKPGEIETARRIIDE